MSIGLHTNDIIQYLERLSKSTLPKGIIEFIRVSLFLLKVFEKIHLKFRFYVLQMSDEAVPPRRMALLTSESIQPPLYQLFFTVVIVLSFIFSFIQRGLKQHKMIIEK